ncbi:MAG: GspH/FimT family pseudopilin [Rubrivivax sp.]|nr:GspH/FimT family pseudopilin [Rubrivivax sp.]
MKTPCTAPSRARQRGFTSLEGLAAVTVLAITLSSVAPSFKQMRDRRHLEGAAAQLATDLRYARSLAVAQRAPVRLSMHTQGNNSCYVVHTGPVADCSCTSPGGAQCNANAQLLQSANFDATGPVRLAANSRSMLFDPDRGTVTPTGTVRLQVASGAALHQVVNIMGRVRACSPQGAMPGYPVC